MPWKVLPSPLSPRPPFHHCSSPSRSTSDAIEYQSHQMSPPLIAMVVVIFMAAIDEDDSVYVKNATHNSLNELMDPLGSLWNQARAGPFRLVRNTLHRRQSFPALKIITWLKCSMWSYESDEPSYMINDGMTKPWGGS